jgi:serine/threonine protein kinase
MYSIPNTNPIKLTIQQKIYHEIDKLIKKNKYTTLNPLPETILLYEIPYAGEYELLDTIKRIDIKSIKIRPSIKNIPKIWNKYQDIIDFASQIITALKYLHRNNIAHLDIKPENIMVEIYKNTNHNTNHNKNNKFRIIDFGYSSIYPFTDYLENMQGTPDYFPQHFEDQSSPAPYLPKIVSNDTKINPETKQINLFTKIDYIYKIDSFCLGRVLYLLRYFYQNYYERHLIQNEKHQPNTNYTNKILRKLFGSSKAKKEKHNQNPPLIETQDEVNPNVKLNQLIEKLLDDNIHNRYYIKDLILS